MSFRIREYHPADTDAVLELWESAKSHGFEPVYGLAEVLASCQKDHAVVAVADDGVSVPTGPTTEDYLWAIGDTRMTVSGEMVGQFLEDIDALARL